MTKFTEKGDIMYNIPSFQDREKIDVRKLVFCTSKVLPDMVYNMSNLEGNPFTFPEVQTLMEGITIGGHKLSDQDQILRIREAWEYVFNLVQSKTCGLLTEDIFNEIHSKVAKNEALEIGKFRTGQVGIGGTEYMPPKHNELKYIFNTGIRELLLDHIDSYTSLAIGVFLWGARNQFYWDGNKRTSRLVANLILMSNGQGVLNIKSKDRLEFNRLMVDFYNTGDGKEVAEFLYKSIDRWE